MSTFRTRTAKAYDLLPPEPRKPRLAQERFHMQHDVEDADFVVLADLPRREARTATVEQPAIRPGNDNSRRRPETVRSNPARSRARSGFLLGERLLGRLSENLFSALVALACLLTFALTGGFQALGGNSGVRSSRVPVEVTHVTATPKMLNGMPILLVNGIIENHGEGVVSSPRLRADVYSGDVLSSTTLFTTATGDIETGESRGFQVKLPQAGGKAPDIRIAFAE